MKYEIESFGITDIGLVRSNNEDAWGCVQDCNFFVLADGLGGHNAGEIASKEAVQSLCQQIENLSDILHKKSLPPEHLQEYVKKSILRANTWVYNLSKDNTNLQGMGTTLCCFIFHNEIMVYGNIGDSRVYLYRQRLEQLSIDHRPSEEVPFSKNILTRALGKQKSIFVETAAIDVQEGDIYFLCSDGLTDYVEDSMIENTLSMNFSLKGTCENLVDIAKMNGGNDNITIVMVKILPWKESI